MVNLRIYLEAPQGATRSTRKALDSLQEVDQVQVQHALVIWLDSEAPEVVLSPVFNHSRLVTIREHIFDLNLDLGASHQITDLICQILNSCKRFRGHDIVSESIVQSIRVPLQNGAGGAFAVGGWVGIGDGLRVVLGGLEAFQGACLASEGLGK